MKIVTAKQMQALEKSAFSHGKSALELMETAGKNIADYIFHYLKIYFPHNPLSIGLLCGKGNNAGDAFYAGLCLLEKGLAVTALQVEKLENCSPLCMEMHRRFEKAGGQIISQIELFSFDSVLIDGLFGTGFTGKVQEPYQTIITLANQSKHPIFAIDLPSGLDATTGKIESIAISATVTLSLGLLKLGFFLEEGWNVVGHLEVIDLKLPTTLIDNLETAYLALNLKKAKSLLPSIVRNRHKYQTGAVTAIAGSKQMPGAAILSCLAAFRGGAGMVYLAHPEGSEEAFVNTPYELIKASFNNTDENKQLWALIKKSKALLIGPGLGFEEGMLNFLKEVLGNVSLPSVIDADALKSVNTLDIKILKQTILTPHHGEMQKLLGLSEKITLSEQSLRQCQAYAEEKQVTLILKGAPTCVFHPGSPIYFCGRGDPGMATAGSGDVLTGLLAALLAEGLPCLEAALLGVFLHGMAGEYAKYKRKTSYGMMASDIIAAFPDAFATLQT